jgi:hypothetical protein
VHRIEHDFVDGPGSARITVEAAELALQTFCHSSCDARRNPGTQSAAKASSRSFTVASKGPAMDRSSAAKIALRLNFQGIR